MEKYSFNFFRIAFICKIFVEKYAHCVITGGYKNKYPNLDLSVAWSNNTNKTDVCTYILFKKGEIDKKNKISFLSCR